MRNIILLSSITKKRYSNVAVFMIALSLLFDLNTTEKLQRRVAKTRPLQQIAISCWRWMQEIVQHHIYIYMYLLHQDLQYLGDLKGARQFPSTVVL